MPKTKNCPTCGTRLLRLYEREHGGTSKSKFWGYLWFCPYKHTAIVDHRKSDAPEIYELGEMVINAST